MSSQDEYWREVIARILLLRFRTRGYIRRQEIHGIFAHYLKVLERLGVSTDGFEQDIVTCTFEELDNIIFKAKHDQLLREESEGVLRLNAQGLELALHRQREVEHGEYMNALEAAEFAYWAFKNDKLEPLFRHLP